MCRGPETAIVLVLVGDAPSLRVDSFAFTPDMDLLPNANYWIARGQEVFGPYTGRQVREYLASGNIVPSDMIRGDTDSEWSSVALLLGLPTQTGAPPMIAAQRAGVTTGEILGYWAIGVGLVGLIVCCLVSPVGVVLGIAGVVKSQPGRRSIAWIGLLISLLAFLVNIGGIILMLYFPQFLPPEMQKMLEEIRSNL